MRKFTFAPVAVPIASTWFLFAVVRLDAGQVPARTIRDGVYTEMQATRGGALYTQHCALCHGPTLAGADGPPLTGVEFMGNWNGLTLADLAGRIQTSMPPDEPGKLTPAETVDVVAHVLKIGKFPEGGVDLPVDAGALRSIAITP